MNSDILEKKFSVGLCLNESIEDIELFLKKYNKWLNSIYFSVPLGRKFYSRRKLVEEYDGNEEKLIQVLKLIKAYNIRLELTLNTRDLTNDDLEQAICFCNENDIIPEEIVCLRDYATYLKLAYPKCELKYSFNNHDTWMKYITETFDTIIVGKALLRNMVKINSFVNQYNITYMLNNGCSFECCGNCGSKNCYKVFDIDIERNGLNYTYARSSIFPSELRVLLEKNPNAVNFKFKISNRPWGLEFTENALRAYISMENPIEQLKINNSLYKVFCATLPISEHTSELDIDMILNYKKELGLY